MLQWDFSYMIIKCRHISNFDDMTLMHTSLKLGNNIRPNLIKFYKGSLELFSHCYIMSSVDNTFLHVTVLNLIINV